MSDMATFQHAFANAVLADRPLDGLSRRPAFAVYRNTSARAAVEALRATYRTVDMLVGEEMFTQVALDFRSKCPPSDPVLSSYGTDFPEFLSTQPWIGDLPYLADVARLDWLWLRSFLASETASPPRSFSDGRRRIGIHPAANSIWLATPAMTIWQAHRNPDGIAELSPDWREEGGLFTRRGPTVHAELIGREVHHLLLTCRVVATPDECISALGVTFPDANANELLERCLASGALIIL